MPFSSHDIHTQRQASYRVNKKLKAKQIKLKISCSSSSNNGEGRKLYNMIQCYVLYIDDDEVAPLPLKISDLSRSHKYTWLNVITQQKNEIKNSIAACMRVKKKKLKDFVFSDLKRVKFISWLYFPARTMELPVDDETE